VPVDLGSGQVPVDLGSGQVAVDLGSGQVAVDLGSGREAVGPGSGQGAGGLETGQGAGGSGGSARGPRNLEPKRSNRSCRCKRHNWKRTDDTTQCHRRRNRRSPPQTCSNRFPTLEAKEAKD